MTADLPGSYVRLGLAFDRLARGFVDAWTGPAAVRAQVESGPAPSPSALAARARELLAELPSAGLAPERAAFLAGQLTGLEMSGRVLAGEPVPYLVSVRAWFQMEPVMGDPSTYDAAHRVLDDLLPGDGPLLERYTAYRDRACVPPERLPEAVRAWSSLLRERTRAVFPLPDEEEVAYEVVTDRPWAGFNYYEGRFRSTVAINADLPVGLGALPALVSHESYPGHHTERCRKQARLTALPELDLWLVNTPENVLAEGLADLGLTGLGLDEWGPVATELYADLGIAYDGERGQQIIGAAAALGAVRQDAALLLHDRNRSHEEVAAYLSRWALLSPERARKTLAFLTDPLWRAYITTYVEGERLLRAWLAAGEAGPRFGRLLDEQLTPAGLRASLPAA
ncbi:MAG: hypothetical protein LH469_06895 [Frankiaceae bacterium]|nr:hypothetical protein [Frankiaceae bacterium]